MSRWELLLSAAAGAAVAAAALMFADYFVYGGIL